MHCCSPPGLFRASLLQFVSMRRTADPFLLAACPLGSWSMQLASTRFLIGSSLFRVGALLCQSDSLPICSIPVHFASSILVRSNRVHIGSSLGLSLSHLSLTGGGGPNTLCDGPLHLYRPSGDDNHPSLPSPLPSGIHQLPNPQARYRVFQFHRSSMALHSYQPLLFGWVCSLFHGLFIERICMV